MLREFLDTKLGSAHDRFQAWRTKHQRGVFLNVGTRTRANLHGARCVHMGSGPPYFSRAKAVRLNWASPTSKRKLCGPESELLARAAKDGITVGRCEQCLRDGFLGAGPTGSKSHKGTIKLRTFRYGDDAKRGQGLRIGTTRRPPRGAAKKHWGEYFDVWFPILAPSEKLRKRGLPTYRRFCASYERELTSRAESRQAVQLLAHLALRTTVSIGCYCEDESKCHRTHLRRLIEREARSLWAS